jgi:hypothetical protein
MSQGLRPGGAAVDQPGVATPGTEPPPSFPAPKCRQSQPKRLQSLVEEVFRFGIHLVMLSAVPGEETCPTAP